MIISSVEIPPLPHYIPAPPTKEDCELEWYSMVLTSSIWCFICSVVEYADLAIIDLSKASTAEGRVRLAISVRDAMKEHGFFYVINHGLTQQQVSKIPVMFLTMILRSYTSFPEWTYLRHRCHPVLSSSRRRKENLWWEDARDVFLPRL